MTWLTDVGLFALLFFILVFIHELGHFLMAKWVGIRVEQFAIGMGPALMHFQKGETEYRLGLLPIGGYVKMTGSDPGKDYTEEERRVGFLTQKPLPKLLVVLGGPGFNLLLPIVVYGLMLATGVPTPLPVIGSVEKESVAEKVGLEPGDKIVSIDEKPVSRWADLEDTVEKSPGKTLNFKVERFDLKTLQTEVVNLEVRPKLVDSKSRFGEEIQIGSLGVSPDFIVPQIFYTDSQSPLAQAGLQKFDRILKVNEVPITTMEQWQQLLKTVNVNSLQITVQRDGETLTKTVQIPPGKTSVEERIGWKPTTMVVGRIEPGSPAEHAGLQVNDFLVAINGKPVDQFEDFAKAIRSSDGKPVQVEWNRDGKIMRSEITPKKESIEDPIMGKDSPLAKDRAFRIGVGPAFRTDMVSVLERSMNPIRWMDRGLRETYKMTSFTFLGLVKLVSGKVSFKSMGGPIMIYKVAGNSYRLAGGGYLGWFSFLSTLAMLSITLGLTNLLPAPILDGGHAALFIVELIRGRPTSVRAWDVLTKIGLVFIMCLFLLVFYNDFLRYGWIDHIVKLFKSG